MEAIGNNSVLYIWKLLKEQTFKSSHQEKNIDKYG